MKEDLCRGELISGEETRVNISDFTKRLVEYIRPLANKKHLHFRYRTERATVSEILADEELLYRIVTGLMEKASRSTAEGGSVILGLRELFRNEKMTTMELYIQDNGNGLRDEEEEKTLEALAEAAGGVLTFESGRGMGTVARFVGTFHVYRNSEPVGTVQGGDFYSFEGKTILIVEDHELNLEIARDMVLRTGANVLCAVDGVEALDVFRAHRAELDLILMDILMPRMDGIEATAQIRKLEKEAGDGRRVPVFALTASAYEDDAVRGREAGMDEGVLKPINPSSLLGLMRRYLF